MKKIYNAPKIDIIEHVIEPILWDTSVGKSDEKIGNGENVDSKGAIFEDDDEDDWNGWN